MATGRTSSESSFTTGLKDVLLSPLPPTLPPPSQRDGYRSCSRSSGPLCRRTRQSDSSRAWISDGGKRRVTTEDESTEMCGTDADTDLSAYLCSLSR